MEILRNNLNCYPRGITMIELMISLAILALLTALVAPSFLMLKGSVALGNASRELQSALRVAQNRAFVAQGGSGASHGVQLEADRYIILGGSQPQTVYLPEGITISGSAVGQTITFTRLNGLPAAPQDVTLESGSNQKVVHIDASGLIRLP